MSMNERSLNRHKNCRTVIRWKQFKDRPTLTPGLYCKKHNKLIMWLNIEQATKMIKDGTLEEKICLKKSQSSMKVESQVV